MAPIPWECEKFLAGLQKGVGRLGRCPELSREERLALGADLIYQLSHLAACPLIRGAWEPHVSHPLPPSPG